MTERQTSDQQTGTGAEDQGQSAKVEERLAQLEADLKAEKDAREKAEKTSRDLQASRDRERARRERLERRQERQQEQPRTQTDLRAFANQQAKRAMLLEALMASGMTEDDLIEHDIEPDELTTPGEVKSAVRLVKLEKQLAEQNQQLTPEQVAEQERLANQQHLEEQPSEDEASGPGPDTGGPSGLVSEDDLSNLDKTYARAAEIKRSVEPQNDAALREARLITLGAIHKDPRKSKLRRKPPELEE